MASYTFPITGGTRTVTDAQMGTIAASMAAAGQTFLKDAGCAFYKLDETQRILISETDNYPAGRRLMELYTPTHDPSMTLGIRWTLKGLSSFADTSTAMQDQGFAAISTLAEGHMLLWDTVPAKSRWAAVDESQEIVQLVQRKTVSNSTQQSFADLSSDEILQMLVRKFYVTNNYTHSFQVNGNVVQNLTLAGLYLTSLGGTSYRLGVSALSPVITLQGNAVETVQASTTASYTDAGASAVSSDGTVISVTVSGDTVDLTQLTGGSPYIIVFSAVDQYGSMNSATRTVHCVDLTNPTIVANAHSSGATNPVELTEGDTWTDPGYVVTDNLDPSPTLTISGTVDTATVGSYSIVATAQDAQGNTATYTRVVNVVPDSVFEAAGSWTSPAWYSTGLGTALTSEVNQMGRGTGHGYEIKFTYKRGSDPQGVIFAITDSSTSSTYYETPSTTAAVAFRIDASAGVKVRFPQSHPTWNNSRYHGDAAGVTNSNQTTFTEVTLRVWDKDSSNWGLFLSVGSNSYTRDMAKSGTGTLLIPGNTSQWTGYSVNCVETAGAVTTSAGWKVTPGGEVKDISIRFLNSSANHTVP